MGERGAALVRVGETDDVGFPDDLGPLRRAIEAGTARYEIAELQPGDVERIAWSGSRAHLENVALQLERARKGEVDYLCLLADGHEVAKGGVDFVVEPGSGTIWQVATHGRLEGLGLATRLIGELEQRAIRRGVSVLRLSVGVDNPRARRLYEHLGYAPIGESEASWEAEAEDGTRYVHTAQLVQMAKPV